MQHGNRGPWGCSRGNNCDRFHPKVCPSSLARGECFNDRCPSPHVKGTRKKSEAASLEEGDRTLWGLRGVEWVCKPTHINKTIFLSTIAALKRELMDAMDYMLQKSKLRSNKYMLQNHPIFIHKSNLNNGRSYHIGKHQW